MTTAGERGGAQAEEIGRQVVFLVRDLNDQAGRYQRAADAGAALAEAVYDDLSWEGADGEAKEKLRTAYNTFMALHSGNFGP